MAAFWAVFTFGGSGPDITAHGSLDLKQDIQIQMVIIYYNNCTYSATTEMGVSTAIETVDILSIGDSFEMVLEMKNSS
jgi:hypothetical protein